MFLKNLVGATITGLQVLHTDEDDTTVELTVCTKPNADLYATEQLWVEISTEKIQDLQEHVR